MSFDDSKSCRLYNGAKIVFETPDDGYSYFFGYYDKSPLNIDNSKLLAHRVSFDGREVRDGDKADIGYFNIPDRTFCKIGETLAWNWQQGSHLQWMPPCYERYIIYNDVEHDNVKGNYYVSRIYDLETGETETIPAPIYALHPGGKFALGVNYERFAFCRGGYDYRNVHKPEWDVFIHPDDGIFRIDFETKKVDLIVRTKDIVDLKPTSGIRQSYNWLEHMMWNPEGSRFLFMHRWNNSKGHQLTRLFTCDSHGENLCFYPDVEFYSHYTWKNNKELSVWTLPLNDDYESSRLVKILKSPFAKIFLKPVYKVVKPFLPEKVKIAVSYRPVNLVTFLDIKLTAKTEGKNILQKDSHQTWFKNSHYLLNDSYEDENYYRHLYLYADLENPEILKIADYFSYYNSCVYRCDLHPRISHDGKCIIIDTAHQKKRCVQVLNINEVIQENAEKTF